MQFEYTNALRDLDVRTPPYHVMEIFHHGSLLVRTKAEQILRHISPRIRTTPALRRMLAITTY
jgi:hypothetical protein